MLACLGPLLPGAPNKRPLVGKDWPHHNGLTVAQLQEAAGSCICWHIGASPDHIAVDIDGPAASALCIAHGCDPATADTWRIVRTGNTERLKLVFKVTPKQKALLAAGSKTVKIDGQELAVFAKHGTQIVVLGDHYTKESAFTDHDDQYAWAGRRPEDAQPLPEAWLNLLVGVFCGDQPLKPKSARTVTPSAPPSAASRGASSAGVWVNSGSRRPCPVCGREHSGACSIAGDGDSVWCCHGHTKSAPDCSRSGETVTGTDGRTWAYVKTEEHDSFGERSLFVLDQPRARSAAPGAASGQPGHQSPSSNGNGPGRGQEDEKPPFTYRELLELALLATRDGDEDMEMTARAEIMGRFKRTDGHITAALFRLLTAQELGAKQRKPVCRSIDLSRIESLEWLVDGFIPQNDMAIIDAPSGGGKTLAALAMAFAVIDGTGFLDRSGASVAGDVLFIASDSGAMPLRRGLEDLGLIDHPAHDEHNRRFHVWAHDRDQGAAAWDVSLSNCLQMLQAVREQRIGLVIIDSCKAVTSRADLNYTDNAQVTALLTFFKEVICSHCSVLWINHDGTAAGATAGAKAWREIPSVCHSIERVKTEREGNGQFKEAIERPDVRGWVTRKSRLGCERRFQYTLDRDRGVLEVLPEVEIIGDCRMAILDVLKTAWRHGVPSLSRQGLIDEVWGKHHHSSKTVENSLPRLTSGREPSVVKPRRAAYALSPRLQQAAKAELEGSAKDGGGREIDTPLRGVQSGGGGGGMAKSQW